MPTNKLGVSRILPGQKNEVVHKYKRSTTRVVINGCQPVSTSVSGHLKISQSVYLVPSISIKQNLIITCIEIFHDGITIDIRIGANTSTNKELKCHLKNSGTRVSISIRPYRISIGARFKLGMVSILISVL